MAAESPYFVFEREVRPVPTEPTHCRKCRAELEPLRRWGGLCAKCVSRRAKRAPKPTEKLRSKFAFVRSFYKQRPGHKERFVEAVCECGHRSNYQWSTWVRQKPMCCKRCRLREVSANGFEAEKR